MSGRTAVIAGSAEALAKADTSSDTNVLDAAGADVGATDLPAL
jgi:hypothetical protein